MTTSDLQSLTIKDIVTQDFHAAAVFEKYSLDFCCRGGKSIDEACREKGITAEPVFAELENLKSKAQESSTHFGEWDADFLIDYIVKNHHGYVAKMIPILYAHTQKVASVHGVNHPEVIEIASRFKAVAAEFQQHMHKEEHILFPFIKALAHAKANAERVSAPPFGSVQNPIQMMLAEHQSSGDEMYAIRKLSSGYTAPDDACTTYRVTFQELRDFELDLHQHVHLENNILFPKAIALEREIVSTN